MHRRRPRLPGFAPGVGRGKAGTAVPQPVGIFDRQEACSPALVLHARSLGGDLVGRGIREIAQHLPPDGGVALEQPVDHIHHRRLDRAADSHSADRLGKKRVAHVKARQELEAEPE